MLTPSQQQALASLDNSGILSAALEALKEDLIRDIMHTDVHESKKREDCYMKYRLIGDLKKVIKAAINQTEVSA